MKRKYVAPETENVLTTRTMVACLVHFLDLRSLRALCALSKQTKDVYRMMYVMRNMWIPSAYETLLLVEQQKVQHFQDREHDYRNFELE